MKAKLIKFCNKIGYQFKDMALLEAALSHRSSGNQNYERLEFLGDSILNFVIAAALFERYPKAHEGELSRLRASLVNGESLAELAKEMEIGDYLRLGPGELKSGGYQRASILADAIEAIIGAIYLDADYVVCHNCILIWFNTRLENITHIKIPKDFKTQLQEYLQKNHLPLPSYTILEIIGEAHAQSFRIECKVASLDKAAEGEGSSRRRAEQLAAEKMLQLLKIK